MSRIGYIKYLDFIIKIEVLDNIKLDFDIVSKNVLNETGYKFATYLTTHYKVILISHLVKNDIIHEKDLYKVNNVYYNNEFYYKLKEVAFFVNFMFYEQYNLFTNNVIDTYRNYWYNGELKEEYSHKNGIRKGKYKSYYINGKMLEECEYNHDKKNGKYKKYHNNGKLMIECIYNHDRIEGEYIEYDKNGKESSIIVNINGEYKNIKEMRDKEIKDKEIKDKHIKDKEIRDKEIRDKKIRDEEIRDK